MLPCVGSKKRQFLGTRLVWKPTNLSYLPKSVAIAALYVAVAEEIPQFRQKLLDILQR